MYNTGWSPEEEYKRDNFFAAKAYEYIDRRQAYMNGGTQQNRQEGIEGLEKGVLNIIESLVSLGTSEAITLSSNMETKARDLLFAEEAFISAEYCSNYESFAIHSNKLLNAMPKLTQDFFQAGYLLGAFDAEVKHKPTKAAELINEVILEEALGEYLSECEVPNDTLEDIMAIVRAAKKGQKLTSCLYCDSLGESSPCAECLASAHNLQLLLTRVIGAELVITKD